MIIERILIFLLFLIGFSAIVAMRNIIKKIFGLNLMNAAVVLLFILEGSRIGSQAPILDDGITHMVDPIPQALMLTAIVIGVCVRLYQATGSLDIDVITKRLADEH